MTMALILGARAILLCSKTVVMSFFLSIDEDRVGIGHFFEDFLRALVLIFVRVKTKCQHAIGLLNLGFRG